MIDFLIHIAGAAALLIWAVRLVRTGVERAFMVQLRLWLRRSARNRLLAAGTGMASAMLLQSSTAVAMLVSNSGAAGAVTSAVGLAILLGADLGSALVAQVLLVRQTWLIPVLLTGGVALFLKGRARRMRQTGRILIGLALIFVALDMLRAATAPLLGSEGALSVLGYLGEDLFAAFLLGALFAWLVHSSVAAVLFFVTMVAQGALPAPAAMAMVLGANLGGSMIAYVLTWAAPPEARRMVVANLALRGGGAVLALVALGAAPAHLGWLGADGAAQAITLHIAFNAGICALALPFVEPISRLADRLVTERRSEDAGQIPSALDPGALEEPARALSCAAREVVRMGERIEAMLVRTGALFDAWDDAAAALIRNSDAEVRRAHREVKLYLAALNRRALDEEAVKGAMELSLLAAALEAASDLLVRNLLDLAQRMEMEGLSFSEAGRREIGDFHDRVLANAQLALGVMMRGNPDDARELVARKEQMRGLEQSLQRRHLARLREGHAESIETSNIHQETLRVLKQVNTSFALAAYPIVEETGDLLSSRLSGGGK
ncbi:Na+/Pi-cotransporter [Pseudoruegeria aquimaris]|uniref:Na+/Pi-cotransporter n=1 Tax=Pseudoruegeria aquimaris TaxID=393663 RepID=A0A1Y5SRB8_9RHOB|nr:Na/Pi cotransporter family protein [Pseudoruegeria aquimaris]SLN46508.1 Na+/Pi-cotransporter [Pseudoruegeria aquimaris]